jgi:cell division protease FtsH
MGRGVNRSQDISESTAQMIDSEVKRIIDECHEKALEILRTHRDKLDLIANLLIERETLEGEDVMDLLEHGRIRTQAERDADEAEKDKESGEKASETPALPAQADDAPAAGDAAAADPSDENPEAGPKPPAGDA